MTFQVHTSLRRMGEGDKGTVRVEAVYPTEIDDLWSAVTSPERRAKWIAEVEGDLRLGGEFQVRFTSSWEGPGRVDACEPPHHLLLAMEPGEDYATTMEAWLTEEGAATRLVVEDRGIPVGELAAHGAGWQVHMEDLAIELAGEEHPAWRDRWMTLRPTYANRPID